MKKLSVVFIAIYALVFSISCSTEKKTATDGALLLNIYTTQNNLSTNKINADAHSLFEQGAAYVGTKNTNNYIFFNAYSDTGKKRAVGSIRDSVLKANALKNQAEKAAQDSIKKTAPVQKDTIKKAPVAVIDTSILNPYVIVGAASNTLGFIAVPAAFLIVGFSWIIPVALIVCGTIFTVIGLKQIKKNRKKWKGEKLANYSFLLLTILGAVCILYPVYLLLAP